MDFFDEDILKARKKAEDAEKARNSAQTVAQEKKQSIYDEFIEIFKVPTKFEEKAVLHNKARVYMPTDFGARPEEEIKLMFPLGNPPQELYGNSYSPFILAFHWTEHQITEGNLPDLMAFAKRTMERMGPRARVVKSDVKKRGTGDIGVMEVVANALQGVSFSYNFYTIMEGRLAIGTVMFDRKYKDRLLPIADEIVESFHAVKEDT